MLKNNLKIALRSLVYQRGYSLINIVGLSISLAVVLLMLLWVQDEWNMDKFHSQGNRIYRLKRTIPLENNTTDVYRGIPYPVLAAAERELPEVEKAIPLGRAFEETLQREDQHFRANGTFGNMAFFESFSFPVLIGDISQLDKKLNAVAISEKVAKKIFGNVWKSNSLGEIIHIHDIGDFSIVAVYEDFRESSTIQNDFVYSLENFLQANEWAREWTNSGMQGALLLHEGADEEEVTKKIEILFQSHQEGDLKEGILLQKFADDYLFGNFDQQARVKGGRIEYVQTFGIAALLLLIISSINFVNLATARASKRAKEVGVRKTIGANKKSLIGQFMVEAGVITLISIGLAVLLSEMLLPHARQITEKALDFNYHQPVFWIGMLTLGGLTTFLSGAYPAFILSSFRPINVLKGKIREQPGHISFRKGLVIFQFILALLLVAGAMVVQQQVHYIKNKNLGINKDNLMVLHQDEKITEKYEALRNELVTQKGIIQVTSAGPSPINNQASTSGVIWPEKRPDQENIEFNILWAESNFPEVFEVPMVSGQFYRSGMLKDTNHIVFNEKAIEIMGLTDPIGQTIQWWGKPRQIIGVIKDYHNLSLYNQIAPTGILLDAEDTGWVYIKAREGMIQDAIAGVQTTFKKIVPEVPLYFEFVDEQYQANYKSEVLTGKLANYFALISILISSLGLLGLAIFLAEQKTREIGIRKVLGASFTNLITLLSREFLTLVGIGLLIGLPVSWYLLTQWLEKFAYKVDLQWWMFLLPMLAAILISGLTIAIQAIRAVINNPIHSLRSE